MAELASGRFSDFYANCTPIFTEPMFQERVALALYFTLPETPENAWVVGSAMGAIGLAQAIAGCDHELRAAYTEHVPYITDAESGNVIATYTELKRFDLGEKPFVILCEDVVTTGGTTLKTMDAIEQKHPDVVFHKTVLAIVNRKPGVLIDGLDVDAIIEVEPNIWDSEEDFPDEMKGCVPIKPKASWEKLVTEML